MRSKPKLRAYVRSIIASAIVILVAFEIRILGYHYIAELNWIDALLNASMILGGDGAH